MNGLPVAVIEGGVTYYIRTDHIERPVFATDSTGTKVWEAIYLPFGGVLTSTGNPITLRFPGQWFQSESGLHQNWMRDYDPTTGRYMQPDPLGLVDGASVYGYARQNPGRYVDPRGEFVGPVIGVAIRVAPIVYRWGRALLAGKAAVGVLEGAGAQSNVLAESGEICEPDDDCESIRAQIDSAIAEMRSRLTAWRIDKHGLLPGRDRVSRRRGSFGGHVGRFWLEQKRLQNLIDLAKARGCDYSPDAEYWANLPIPFNGNLAGIGTRF